jgi:cold shock CspA family protein
MNVAQGTIKEYDATTGVGALLTDDRTEVTIDERSIGDDAIRTLRLGQRVVFEVEAADTGPIARSLRLVTF